MIEGCTMITSPQLLPRSPRPETHLTPGGTKEWFPCCPEEAKPCLGKSFQTLQDGIKFYMAYAKICHFVVRKSSTTRISGGIVSLKHCLCNKAGFKEVRNKNNQEGQTEESSTRRRRTKITRTGCNAKCVLKYYSEDGTYRVLVFHEGHNHCLASPMSSQYLKSSRKMTVVQKNFIANNARVNIGPVKSFRIYKEQVGGYGNVGATLQDFKNFHRDMKEYIKDQDGKMLIENFL